MRGSKIGSVLRRISGSVPEELVPGLAELQMIGNRSLRLESHRGLRAFSGKCVLVSVGSGLLCIRGQNLILKRLSLRELWLKGDILSLELTGKDAT